MSDYVGGVRHELSMSLDRLYRQSGRRMMSIAQELHWSTSKVSRILSNSRGTSISYTDLRALLDLFEVDPMTRAHLLDLCDRGRARLPYARAFGGVLDEAEQAYYEALLAAPQVRIQSSGLLPMPLQSPAYHRATLEWHATPRPEVAWRLGLLQHVTDGLFSSTADITLIMDESALRRCTRADLEYVQSVAWRYSVHVFPFSAGITQGLMAAFTLLSFPDLPMLNMLMESRSMGSVVISRRLDSYRMADGFWENLAQGAKAAGDFADIVTELLDGSPPG